MQFAPRLPPSVLDIIERHAIERVPIAEINRRVGAHAARLGRTRPSYQRVRVLVHEARELHRLYVPAGDILLDIATRTRSPFSITELATRPPRRRLRDRIT